MSHRKGTMGLHAPFMPLITALCMLHAPAVLAHMMPAQQGTLNILGDSVFEVVSVPVSALAKRQGAGRQFDDDGDGRLSVKEVSAHQAELQQAVSDRFRLYDGHRQASSFFAALRGDRPAAAGTVEFVWIRAEHDERSELSTAGAKQVLALLKTRFAGPPQDLTLKTDLFGSESTEGQLTIRAKRGTESEVAVLRPLAPAHRFFRGYFSLFVDFIGVGVEHILLGVDHLLFLSTVLIGVGTVGAGRWRAFLAALTSFTIAHSLTLGLAVFQVVILPARPVECLIAASIVLCAGLNLRRAQTSITDRVAIVFACGLLHGLGFASAITTMGVVAARRAVSLCGFNVGIELGQLLFLLVLLCAAYVLSPISRRLPEVNGLPTLFIAGEAIPGGRPSMSRLVSLLAVGLGTLFFIERLFVAA